MKNGLFQENGQLIYYRNDQPVHAGAVRIDGDIYYISSNGVAATGEHIVHGEMTNGILKRGTYRFGPDGKLIPGSYVAPKKAKKKCRRKKLSKKQLQGLTIGLSLLMCFLLVILSIFLLQRHELPDDGVGDIYQQDENEKVSLPTFTTEIRLCSDYAKKVFDGTIAMSNAAYSDDPYQSFIFEYKLTDQDGTLLISERPDMANAMQYVLQPGYHKLAIDNLKTGTDYYYQVTADGQTHSGTFTTAASHRFLNIPGLVNTRDIGGVKTMDGKTVKQGVLIRGVELDGLVAPDYFLPASEVDGVQKTFGFVHEMDLRSPKVYAGSYQSKLGDNVTHAFYEAPQYGQIFTAYYQERLRSIFTDLADPSKYPMYLHCTHGADRSGTVVFLLQGVLNMSQDDMVEEFRLTGHTYQDYGNSNQMDVIIEGVEPYEGDTLQEKICSYLTDAVGVTEEQLTSIRNIYLED